MAHLEGRSAEAGASVVTLARGDLEGLLLPLGGFGQKDHAPVLRGGLAAPASVRAAWACSRVRPPRETPPTVTLG